MKKPKFKFLLAAVNAKYIHSNLAVHSLKAYAARLEEAIVVREYTINMLSEHILKDIYLQQPDAVGFSCYIWNIAYIKTLLSDLKKVLPDIRIWLGGPEVSYDSRKLLQELSGVTGIMTGEGEETFYRLMAYYTEEKGSLAEIPGLVYRDESDAIIVNPPSRLMDLNQIPFCYDRMEDFDHKIVYYESSRGCPFSCSYCLSSIDKSVRFRSPDLVKKELDFFLERKVPQVKFVDRTFNCNHQHAQEIWNHILENDNGITNFHFEISADLLNDAELNLLSRMRPGLMQLEIGVQSVNADTIREIRRTMDLPRLGEVVTKLNEFGNIHLHLDLIAGLPYEDIGSFRNSFDQIYALKPQQLQLGFLKVLHGSFMKEKAVDYGLICKSEPPYEVLSTDWISYEDILLIKGVEEMVELYYNSNQFLYAIAELEQCFEDSFTMFWALAQYYERKGYLEQSHSRNTRYEILFSFITENFPNFTEKFRRLLTYDLYLRENIKKRPSFLTDQTPFKEKKKTFFMKEEKAHRYLRGYEGLRSAQISKMAHLEAFIEDGEEEYVLFDYQDRDPLTYNARTLKVAKEDIDG